MVLPSPQKNDGGILLLDVYRRGSLLHPARRHFLDGSAGISKSNRLARDAHPQSFHAFEHVIKSNRTRKLINTLQQSLCLV